MADTLSIAITGDVSGLQAALDAAADSINDTAGAIVAQAQKSAQASQAQADRIIAIHKQTNDAIIAGEQQLNVSRLALGQESLTQFTAQENNLAKQKYDADLSALKQEEASGKLTHGEYLASKALLDQQYANRAAQIGEQAAQKQREIAQTELADFEKSENDRLSAGIAAISADYNAHHIGADQKHDLEIALTSQIETEVLKRFDAENAGLEKGTEAWAKAMKDRQALIDGFNKNVQTANDQLETEEAQKWTELGNSIKSSFNSAIDGMLFEGKSFQQGMIAIAQGVLKAFLSMGETIAENWIETQIASLFETKATQTTSALGQISDAAAVAGANTFASTAAIPVIGPELAPGAAAAAIAQVMGFSSLLSLDTGAWDLKTDAVAQLHKGEMVVPQNFAAGMRANGGAFAGSDVALHYAPTIQAREPASLAQMLSTHGHEMHAWIRREFRNGALRA
ncbi:MAG TPA: hypothetical protein VII49_02795 [Rhizomicrobium sp.]